MTYNYARTILGLMTKTKDEEGKVPMMQNKSVSEVVIIEQQEASTSTLTDWSPRDPFTYFVFIFLLLFFRR